MRGSILKTALYVTLFSTDADIYENSVAIQENKELFELLALSQWDVVEMFKSFHELDEDNSGEISLTEMLCGLEVPRANFNERVFAIFDEDGSGEIDFREFVLALWNYW